ncbi:MAG: cation-translocating P-type ATPase [Firmicutes bacterium]|nr:cation-translocating P-type ATPase [Bacillota bacterium]
MDNFYNYTKSEIFNKFRTSESGLTNERAEALLKTHGLNKLAEAKKKHPLILFLAQFKDIMVIILLIAAVVVAAVGLFKQEYNELLDAGIILIIVLLNAVINFIQQNKADKSMESLKRMNQAHAKVVRGGQARSILAQNIALGELITLEAGDIVPADMFITKAHSLQVNESALTGESHSVTKTAAERLGQNVALGDRTNMVHSGSVVSYGRGAGVAVRTGMNTEVGKIAHAINTAPEQTTPLQQKLNRVGTVIGVGVLIIAAFIFVLNVLVKDAHSIFDSLLVAIALAVAAIPESLPAAVTIIMALSVGRMSKKNAIIRRLSAVETLGSCQVICSDKTGTLTQNKMTVVEVFMPEMLTVQNSPSPKGWMPKADGVTAVKAESVLLAAARPRLAAAQSGVRAFNTPRPPDGCPRLRAPRLPALATNSAPRCLLYASRPSYRGELRSASIRGIASFEGAGGRARNDSAHELIRCMLLCSDSTVSGGKVIGNPTENALVEYGLKQGFNKKLFDEQYRRIDELPFDSNRKLMTTFNMVNGKVVGYTKGSPDNVLDRCTHYLQDDEMLPLTGEVVEQMKSEIVRANSKALRTLAFAYKECGGSKKFGFDNEQGLTFIGFAGLIDPPRPEVAQAIKTCKAAGMTTVMITGDHLITALAIARQIGLAEREHEAITGKQLDAMSDAEFKRRIESIKVYARVSPENKVRIVDTWKSLGKVVAMTGDGVNDAPSLKRADIGIGMGISGTELTRQVADMVLADDNFATIVVAVREGRRILDNIKKAIRYMFSTNLTEVISILTVTMIAPKLTFLLPIQILFINLVTDGLPAIALGMQRSEKDIMNRKPVPKTAGLFSGGLGKNIITEAAMQSVIVISLFFAANALWGNAVATTCAFITLSLIQLFHAWNVRTHTSIFKSAPHKDRLMLLAFGLGLGLNLMIALTPGIAAAFGVVPLTLTQWAVVALCSMAIIPLVEVYKLITVFASRSGNARKRSNPLSRNSS